ncbi:MAG: hypothetical protein FD161_1581 [Limisphaerales bacterium]|nr:MAG: hypothetical protein FD161_1581 [Limisphaerales bacterium]KAG0509395.1 MAG: hypothetical protein E1N63_1500 [Limisphaerales bacterium]TXT52140.1 MAG: hypothetical protein FD140_1073 [Limisphaerales bacterium]
MNAREKLLASLVLGGACLFGGALGIRAFIMKPLTDLDKRIVAARERLGKIQAERRSFFTAEDRLKALGRLTFADSVDEASARSGEALTKQILQAGLDEGNFTRLPLGPRKLRGASEIGWNVQGDGALATVVNLLFILEQSPHLQRLDGLVLSQAEKPGEVRVRFRCLTLVFDPAPDVKREALLAKASLKSDERRVFDGIVSRDLLRPYIKRPPPPPVVAKAGVGSATATPATPPAPPGPETFRVVSLSEWQGQPEAHVRDLTAQKTVRYKPGDALAGGTIALVDYRAMPLPGTSGLQSFSRVIVRVKGDYFAIERGQTLADLRKLELAQLPPELVKPVVEAPRATP